MRLLRALAILIFAIGLFSFIFGILLLTSLESNMQVMEEMQRGGMAQNIDIPTFRWIILKASIQYVVVGVLTVVSAAGIFFARNWGRRLWFAILVFTTLMGIYMLVTRVLHGTLDTSDVIGISVSGLFIASMFFHFSRTKTKALFSLTVEANQSPLQN